MLRLGLRMSVAGGREALTRLAVTMAAVGIGVTLLLSVLAMYHGYEVTANRPCWPCTAQTDGPGGQSPPAQDAAGSAAAANAELWNYTEDFYRGHLIARLDVAALGSRAPVVPGLSGLPQAGQYYVSPALAKLLARVARDELGDRFPGAQAGTIGAAGLSGPDDLAIIIGRPAAELAKAPNTRLVTAVQTAPHILGTSNIYKFGFGLGAVGLLVPMLILIGNATRLAAARREERYAAMRLVGATNGQVSVVASVEAVIGALAGSVLGAGGYALLRPLAAQITITDDRVFPQYLTPTVAGYAAVLVGVPVAAGIAALLSLRRVAMSPLGASRRATPRPPRAWRIVPLLAGIVAFVVPLAVGGTRNPNAGLAALSLLLVMTGLMVGGEWLTMQASRLLGRCASGPSSLLAARRMADRPKVAFRSVSGLVLAVFVGTLLAGAVPAALAAQQTPTNTALDQVLRLSFGGPKGIAPTVGATLVHQLAAIPGTTVLPIYAAPGAENATAGGPPTSVFECHDLARLPTLGQCLPGVSAVRADAGKLLSTDNVAALNADLPLVTSTSPPAPGDLANLNVQAVLVNVDSAATLEKVRTFLTVNYLGVTGGGEQSAPQTFGEVAAVRGSLYTTAGNVVLLVVGLTLLVAGLSLAIAMAGSIVERKRPFTLLRVAGTGSWVLGRVVLLESVLPLLAATVVAAIAGFALSIPIDLILTPTGTAVAIRLPDHTYYLTMGTGLIISLAVIASTLPLLNRVTVPDNARFE